MTHLCNDDGLNYLDRGEHYRVSGYVTVRIPVAYTTNKEPGDDERDLWDAVTDITGKDVDIVNIDELEYETEAD